MEAPEDFAARLADLERRLDDERQARFSAERAADQTRRDLEDRQRQLDFLEAMAAAANEDRPAEEAIGAALTAVSRFVGWQVAHAFVRADDEADPRLRSSGVWYEQAPDLYTEFKALTETLRPGPGHGLPGRALVSARTAWMVDAAAEPVFLRRDVAIRAGLRAGFAMPVMVGAEVAAVLEFFADKPIEPEPQTLKLMEQVGAILGRILERQRSAARLIEKNLELTRMVAEAEAQRQAAERASRAKTDFLAVTSHEIRTPLNAVLGMAEALRREDLSDRQKELVEGVVDGGAMLLRLLNAVLDLSKIEAGKMIVRNEPLDLGALAERVVRIWRPRAEGQSVRLDLDLSRVPEGCTLLSDVGKIEQTLVNLLSNALKFSPLGGRVRLALGALERGGVWKIRAEVQDQGPGVQPEDQGRIFQPFVQGDEGRRAGGTGLGLSICAGNIALLGGRMGVDTPKAGGARFWFEFKAPKVEASPRAAPAPTSRLTSSGKTLRVLAAEDNPANQRVLRALLAPLNIELMLVGDGRQAVEAARTEAFDLILMDVNMPVMDGVAATRALRALSADAQDWPIYMLTANAFDEDVRRYLDAGADGVLTKPINTLELCKTIEAVRGLAFLAAPERRIA